ncbi:cyclopropane-fatty-acyl-phospholipid synthase, partial [Candidatus Kaiserbacteria bacterium CG10_big_fil_rev_8_21_14_0_10_43_70]
MGSKEKAIRILSRAGVEVNGNKPWDIQVHDERFYNRVFGGGSLALGESYMDAWWDAEDLAAFLTKLLCVKLE